MPHTTITCSNCGYARDLAAAALPRQRVNVTCPRCKHVFVFDPAASTPPQPPAALVPPPPLHEPAAERISLDKGLDAKANKQLFLLFLLLILVTVGIRLWADARFKSVPYPNLMAASSEGVAINCGQNIYVYGADGKLLRSHTFPAEVHPTQLFWDKGALCLGDIKGRNLLVFTPRGHELRQFSGATTAVQFKVAREPATGRLFVSDGAKHKILVYDEKGTYLHSFGSEGTRPGEFRFPNELAFDEAGQLLIANTKRPAIEVYSPDGRFLSTLVNPAGDRTYRFPTDFVITPERLLVLENDGFLERAKVRVYDRQGVQTSELPLGKGRVIGDIVADGERLYLSDCIGRQLLVYSLANLQPLQSFSPDFSNMCGEWHQQALFFRKLSTGSLVLLLLFCAPVIFFYLRMKRAEAKALAQIELPSQAKGKGAANSKAAGDLILGTPINPRQQKISIALLGGGVGSILLAMIFIQTAFPPTFPLAAVTFGLLAFVSGLLFLMRAGGFADWKRKQTEATFKRLVRDKMLALLPDEQVEKVVLAQHGQAAQDQVLLVFSNRRLLLHYLNWNKVARIEQCPLEAIIQVKPPSGRMLEVLQSMQVTIMVEGKSRVLKYFYPKADFLQLLCQEFSSRIGKSGGLPYAILCLTCSQPLQGDYCATCATRLTPDRQAMWLSMLFPGLGQLRNGELQKGLVFASLAVVFILMEYLGIKGWFFEGADLNFKQKANLSILMAMAPLWYVANIVDAYRSSISGRKPR